MELEFSNQALKDLKYWKKIKNIRVQKRISSLLETIIDAPYEGLGNPEELKHQLSGYWSRKINQEHRLVYAPLVEESKIIVISLRFYY